MKCPSCEGNITRTIPDYLKDEPPYPVAFLRCDKCGRELTWREYWEMKCDMLVEMWRKGRP